MFHVEHMEDKHGIDRALKNIIIALALANIVMCTITIIVTLRYINAL